MVVVVVVVGGTRTGGMEGEREVSEKGKNMVVEEAEKSEDVKVNKIK